MRGCSNSSQDSRSRDIYQNWQTRSSELSMTFILSANQEKEVHKSRLFFKNCNNTPRINNTYPSM